MVDKEPIVKQELIKYKEIVILTSNKICQK